MDIRLSISISPPPRPLPELQTPLAPLPQTPSSTSMPLPPEAVYSSKAELYTAIQTFAAQYNYAFSISRSTKVHRGARTRIVYSCDRYSQPPPANHPQKSLHDRKRSTTTRKTGCKFSLVALKREDIQ
jgi:hypothetical protein